MAMNFRVLLQFLVVCAAGAGGLSCSDDERREAAPPPVSVSELKNAVYPSPFTPDGLVRLENGVARIRAGELGDADVTVSLTKFILGGTLAKNRAGIAVILRSDAKERGTFFDLVALERTGRGLIPVASIGLGDRIKIRSLYLDDAVILHMTVHGPTDAPCCPSLTVRNVYVLRGKRLELQSSGPAAE